MIRKTRFYIFIIFSALSLSACGVSSGGGGGGAANVPRFAYTANQNDDSVSMYTVNASTGQLRHHGYVAAGNGPASVTVDAAGKFAYLANWNSNNVSAYTINASTGVLTAVTGSPFTAESWPISVTTTYAIQ